MIAALNGYVVMDLTTQLPGPYCSMLLADHGAVSYTHLTLPTSDLV